MAQSQDPQALAVLIELVTRLLKEKSAGGGADIKAMLAALARNEIGGSEVAAEIMTRFQFELAPAIRALAAQEDGKARDVADQMLKGLQAIRAEIGGVEAAPALAIAQPDPAHTAPPRLKDKADGVLLREYVMMRMLVRTDMSVTSAELFKAARELAQSRGEDELPDETVTAHLARLVKAHVVQRPSKGRFARTPSSRDHVTALAREIASRGLNAPET